MTYSYDIVKIVQHCHQYQLMEVHTCMAMDSSIPIIQVPQQYCHIAKCYNKKQQQLNASCAHDL